LALKGAQVLGWHGVAPAGSAAAADVPVVTACSG
jgi:hypothetical protein